MCINLKNVYVIWQIIVPRGWEFILIAQFCRRRIFTSYFIQEALGGVKKSKKEESLTKAQFRIVPLCGTDYLYTHFFFFMYSIQFIHKACIKYFFWDNGMFRMTLYILQIVRPTLGTKGSHICIRYAITVCVLCDITILHEYVAMFEDMLVHTIFKING